MKVNVIAEIGSNHQGDIDLMKEMMIVAKRCGADYVKSQKREPKLCLTEEQYKGSYISPHSFGKTYGEHKEALEFSKEEWKELFEFATDNEIKLFASVFDTTSTDLMNELGSELFKIGSAEVNKLQLLEHIKSFDKPIILSTGMSTLEEIDIAVDVLRGSNLTLMHCTSSYPCKEEDVNLNIIKTLRNRYSLPLGLSGHYVQGSGAIECAAVALGAVWVERHFTLDRTMKGSDQSSSLEAVGLERVIKSIRSVEKSMGSKNKTILECEKSARIKFKS
jgi:N-acetylneuraminate synthase/sialic acid synthase